MQQGGRQQQNIAAGYWAVGALLAGFDSDLFHIDAYVLARSYILTTAAIVLAAFASRYQRCDRLRVSISGRQFEYEQPSSI